MSRIRFLLPLLVACAPTPSHSKPTLTSAAPPVMVPGNPELHVTLRAPSRVTYDVNALGPSGQFVTIRVENVGAHAVRVAPLRAGFAATREGVAFPCRENVGDLPRQREPSWLGPGQSFAFERELDCRMALPGVYDVSVFAGIGDDGAAVSPRTPVGFFRIAVEAPHLAPRAVPSRAGLFAVMTGGKATPPMAPEAWARGDYRVVVAMINGSPRPLPVGPGRLAFLVYRKGSPLPCSGQASPIMFPEELASGATHVVRAPVACAPSSEGKYEIVGNLSLGEEGESFEIGRVGLRVTSDPRLFTPMPWSVGERSGTWIK